MSIYSPPERYPSIFNPAVFTSSTSSSSSSSSSGGITSAEVAATYAKLAGGQTIVGTETFTTGILTGNIGPTGDTKVSVNSNLQVTGWVGCNTFQPSSGSVFTWNAYTSSGTPYNFLAPTLTGTAYCVLGKSNSSGNSIQLGYNASDSTGSLSINGTTNPMLYFNKSNQLGINTSSPSYTLHVNGNAYVAGTLVQKSVTSFSSSFSTAATTHTITSTELSWLANSNWSGELKLFADDSSTNAGIIVVYLHKPSTILYVTEGTKSTSMTKFTCAKTTNSEVSLTVELSNSSRLCWQFTGAT